MMKQQIIHFVRGNPRKPTSVIMEPRCGARAPYTSLTLAKRRVTCAVCLADLNDRRI